MQFINNFAKSKGEASGLAVDIEDSFPVTVSTRVEQKHLKHEYSVQLKQRMSSSRCCTQGCGAGSAVFQAKKHLPAGQ